MNLSQHFTLEEFTASDTALRKGFDNSLPAALLAEANLTAQMMERIRTYLSERAKKEIPISVTSGYRCLLLNRDLLSDDSSDHRIMKAVDFKAPAFGTPLVICRALQPVMDQLGIGQLIYEHTWVHVSSRTPDKLVNRVLTLQGPKRYGAGILEI